MIRPLTATPAATLTRNTPPPSGTSAEPRDEVVLGGRPEEALPKAPTADRRAESHEGARSMPMWMKLVAGGLAGLTGMLALTGCGNNGPTPPVIPNTTDTQQVIEAKARLEKTFQEIEKSMDASKGDTKQASDEVTSKLMDAVKSYTKDTGRTAQQVGNDLTDFMKKHPAVTLTVAFTVGTVAGVTLEKLGITDGLSNGLASIKQAAQDHPLVAGLIVTGVAAGTAWVIYEYATADSQPVAPVPDTPASRELAASLDQLEAQAKQARTDAETGKINKSALESVKDYAQKSGRSAVEVASDVKTYLVDHPAVAAAVVLSAGVGTGIVLEKAGVPDKVAAVASVVIESGKDGLGNVGQAIKDHPYIAGAVAVGVAAGASYLIYQALQPAAPAAS